MRPARRDVVAKKLAVDVDRGVYVRHDGVVIGTEAAAPHLVAHDWFIAVGIGTVEIMPVHTEQKELTRNGPLIAVAAIAGLGAVAAVYGVVGASRNAGEPLCRPALDLARHI